jgi:hypothetical protein
MSRPIHCLLVLTLGLLQSALLWGQNPQLRRPDLDRVPTELQSWGDWAIGDDQHQLCPWLSGVNESWRCAWPGLLSLTLDEQGAAFSQTWQLYREEWVPLPGDVAHWPQEVLVGGTDAPVLDNGKGRPRVRLGPGVHRVQGRLAWSSIPESLALTPELGLLRLRVNGRLVPFPRVESDGRLLLSAADLSAAEVVEEHVEISVHRRLHDSVPAVLTTRLVLDVAGQTREMVLAPTLPDGFTAYQLESRIPARLEADNRLRLQLSAGRWEVYLRARHPEPLTATGMQTTDEPWGPDEVWVFEADPSVRVIEIAGVQAADPRQTTLLPDWQSLPAYRLFPGDRMSFVEKRRGDSDPAPDRLALSRNLWLDFDGGGYTIQDNLSGQIMRNRRLEMGPETELGRVAVGGVDQLITHLEGGDLDGLEIRQGELGLVAESRHEGSIRSIPAVGWQLDADSLSGRLHLPPGWRLLAAFGVDRSPQAWLDRWSLLDLFLCCLAVMAVLRLRERRWAILAAATLALSWNEPGALQWTWLWLLVAVALAELLPEGKTRLLGRWFLVLMLVLATLSAIPFLIRQVRISLYPVLEHRAPSYQVQQVQFAEEIVDQERSKIKAYPRLTRQAETPRQAAVQTGPGLPAWVWNQVTLQWSGPVAQGQRLRLLLVPPWINRTLGFVRCGLMVALLIVLLRPRRGSWRDLLPIAPASAAAVTAGVLFLLLLSAAPATAQVADTAPDEQVLSQLKQLLLEPPPCAPACADLASLDLELVRDELQLQLSVHALVDTAVPLPGGAAQWLPQEVSLDGRSAPGLVRRQGSLWVLVPAGVHQLRLTGQTPDAGQLSLPLPLRPRHVSAAARGWRIGGLHRDGQADDVLQLTRIAVADDTAGHSRLTPGELPPYLTVSRTIVLGLSWEVQTTVSRLSPTGTPIVIEVPLLEGESVTSADIRVESDHALVNMPPGAELLSWSSSLEQTDQIRLAAPAGDSWTEHWRLQADPIWHVEADGIPPIHQPVSGPEQTPEWRPWPGEELQLKITKPEGVAGATVTIQSSKLQLKPGIRATEAVLGLLILASHGGSHTILLPESAGLTGLTLDEDVLPAHQEGRQVQVPLRPGMNEIKLEWRQPGGFGLLYRSPEIDLGSPGVNADLTISVPYGRWLLVLLGPRVGPAVLYWSLLVVLIGLAWGLGRISGLPLRSWQWLLLLLGLSQVHIVSALTVVCWFLALLWRRRTQAHLSASYFNLSQLALVGWTVIVLLVMFSAIYQGLLDQPEMYIRGNLSSENQLNWFQDRCSSQLPAVLVLSLPLVIYRLAMLAWALWLAAAMVGWLRWAWQSFSTGEVWRSVWRSRVNPEEPEPAEPEPAEPEPED